MAARALSPLPATGRLSGKLERFLMLTVSETTQARYAEALRGFRSSLAAAGVSWATMSEEDRDIFVAEHVALHNGSTNVVLDIVVEEVATSSRRAV